MSQKRRSVHRGVRLVGSAIVACVSSGAALAQTPTVPPSTTAPSTVAPSTTDLSPADQSQWNDIQAAINRQDYRRAEPLLRTWLQAHPDDRNAHFFLAYALMFQGKSPDAITEFDNLLTQDPNNADYLFGKARALVRANRDAEAIPLLDQARPIAANADPVYRLEIEALRKTGDKDKLATVQAEAAQKYPGVDWNAVGRAPVAAPGVVDLAPQVQVGFTYDKLDNGFKDWHSIYVEGVKPLAPRKSVYGIAESDYRFGLNDTQFTGGLNYPLTPRLTATGEVSVSPEHHFLPQYSVLGQLGYGLGGGWGVIAGERHSKFSNANIDLQYLTIEKYFNHLRAAYTISAGEGTGGGTAIGHTGNLTYFYGADARSSIGITIGGGQTPVSVGPPLGVVKSSTTDVSLDGLHWFQPNWAVAYDLGYHKLGGFYTRRTFGLGVRHRF